jgi:UDP-glucose 4-epimerase
LLGEQIVEWAHQKLGLRHTILRLTNVYGPRGEKYGLPIIVRKALAGESIELMGGSQVMNFLYVVDAANAIAKCINDSRSDNQAFNVGSEEQLTVDQLLARISELVGRPLTIVRAPARPGETQWFKPDIAKIHRELDWSPTTSLNEGISRLIASYRASADSDS